MAERFYDFMSLGFGDEIAQGSRQDTRECAAAYLTVEVKGFWGSMYAYVMRTVSET
jgi:hypothetical protein